MECRECGVDLTADDIVCPNCGEERGSYDMRRGTWVAPPPRRQAARPVVAPPAPNRAPWIVGTVVGVILIGVFAGVSARHRHRHSRPSASAPGGIPAVETITQIGEVGVISISPSEPPGAHIPVAKTRAACQQMLTALQAMPPPSDNTGSLEDQRNAALETLMSDGSVSLIDHAVQGRLLRIEGDIAYIQFMSGPNDGEHAYIPKGWLVKA